MKKIIASILCVLLLLPILAGCGLNLRLGDIEISGSGQRFDVNDSKELDMAGAESIRISSVSDDIVVKSGGSKVLAELKGDCYSTSKPVWLDARRDGGSIVIEVKYPGIITSDDTMLTVTIPADYAGDFSASSVSGDIDAQGLPFKLRQVTLGSVSGNIGFAADSFTKLKADTTSGGITLSGIAAETAAGSISGDVSLEYNVFAETSVTTISGGVEASIPQNAAFKVSFGSVSGNFSSTHPGIAVDNADRSFSGSANGGDALLKVHTTSGNLRITGK